MTVQEFSPVLSELPYGRINGKAASTTADADGWYYKPCQPVKITADHTFGKTTANTDFVAGLVEAGLNSYDTAGVQNANDRLGVVLLKGKRVDIVPASEQLVAGDLIYITYEGKAAKTAGAGGGSTAATTVYGALTSQTGTVADTVATMPAVTAASEDLSVAIPALTVSGSTDAAVHGIVWKGGAANADVEVIIF